MRLLFLSDRYWPAIGGVEAMVRNLAQGLAGRGHDVSVVAVSNRQAPLTFAGYSFAAQPAEEYRDGKVEVRILGASLVQRMLTLPVAARYIPYFRSRLFGQLAEVTLPAFRAAHRGTLEAATRSVDVVHGFGAQYLGAVALRAARGAGVPFAITPFCHPGHWGDDPMNVATYRAADLVLGLNDPDLETYRRMGVAHDRLALLPVPVVPAARPSGKWAGGRYVLYLGRVNAYKGIPELFAAWAAVRRRTGVELLLAGPADEPIALPEGVRQLGTVGDDVKRILLAGCEALVLPSRGEIMPNVILEAWDLGAAVVVSDIPALASFVRDGVDGIVTSTAPEPLAAALIRVIQDGGLKRRLGRAGLARVRHQHAPDRIISGLLERYSELLGSAPVASVAGQ